MKKIYFITLLTFFIVSCKKYEAKIPSYIIIDNYTFITDYPSQGTVSNNIKDVIIDIDGIEYGIYELPCKVPVTNTGTINLTIKPVVKENGQTYNKVNYFYYANFKKQVTLNSGDSLKIIPEFTYETYAKFNFKEDFESSAISLSKTTNSLCVLLFDAINKKEGLQGGKVELDKTKNIFEATSNASYALPTNSDLVFCEMDYSCTNNFTVGVQFTENGLAKNANVFTFLPTTSDTKKPSWNKIYINLTPAVASYPNVKNFKLRLFSIADSNRTQDLILFDNIKIVSNTL